VTDDGPDGRPPGSKQPQPTFLPPEDPFDRPVQEPPADLPAGPPPRSPRIWLIVGVAALMLPLAATGIWFVSRHGASPDPSSTPAAAAGAGFHRLPPPCSTVSAATVRRLVPSAGTLSTPGKLYVDQISAQCDWDDSLNLGKRHDFEDRSLKVVMTAYLDGGALPGDEAAKTAMNGARTQATQTANKTDDTGPFVTTYGPYRELTGLGDEALSEYHQGQGLGTPGTATVDLRIRNAVVHIVYGGADPAGSGTRPLPDRTARQAAETVAREVAQALTSCTTCAN
jgi:hypothetical protein